MGDTARTVLCIIWVLILLDSIGALVFWSDGAFSSWYSVVMPKLAEVFPIHNGWPWVYFGLAVLGGITIVQKPADSCTRSQFVAGSVRDRKESSR